MTVELVDKWRAPAITDPLLKLPKDFEPKSPSDRCGIENWPLGVKVCGNPGKPTGQILPRRVEGPKGAHGTSQMVWRWCVEVWCSGCSSDKTHLKKWLVTNPSPALLSDAVRIKRLFAETSKTRLGKKSLPKEKQLSQLFLVADRPKGSTVSAWPEGLERPPWL